jgi:hypothetical protein
LISSFAPTIFASQRATRSAVARPSAPRSKCHRHQAAADRDALGLRLLDLMAVGLHLVDTEHRGQRHLAALLGRHLGHVVGHPAAEHRVEVGRVAALDVPQPPRHRGHVDRGVAAAHHHHTFAHVLQAAVVEGLQEGGGRDHVGCIAAACAVGNRQRPAGLGAQAEKDRVEFGADLLHRHVAADALAQAGHDPQVEDALDLGVQHVTWCAKTRDAVTHHAAQLRVFVKDRDAVALERQLVGTGQPGRPAADHRHRLAAALGGRRRNPGRWRWRTHPGSAPPR